METAEEMIALVEERHPNSTKPGVKRGNTKFEKPVQFKHVPTNMVVEVTAVSVHPDSFNMALVPEFTERSLAPWWRPVREFVPVQ